MNLPAPAQLVPYGIHNEQSDIRAHVAVFAQRVLVYQTRRMIALLSKRSYTRGYATQPGANGATTGEGILVPISDIPWLRTIPCPKFPWDTFPIKGATTSEKGAAAVSLVCLLLKHGGFPLWVFATESKDSEIQVQGTDIIIAARQRIQVKCDWCAGLKQWHPQCTGNLFIQTAEINPFKRT